MKINQFQGYLAELDRHMALISDATAKFPADIKFSPAQLRAVKTMHKQIEEARKTALINYPR